MEYKVHKVVLDTNIIDYCLEFDLTKDFFDNLDIEIWIPTYVKKEIKASNKVLLINKLEEITKSELGFFGFANNPNAVGFGKGNFYSRKYNTFIKETTNKHKNDRLIALLSKINNCIFITGDNKIFQDACCENIKTIFISKSNKSYEKAVTNSNSFKENIFYEGNLNRDSFIEILQKSKK